MSKAAEEVRTLTCTVAFLTVVLMIAFAFTLAVTYEIRDELHHIASHTNADPR